MERQHLEKCFGLIAIEKRYANSDHLIEALKTRVLEDMEKGELRPLKGYCWKKVFSPRSRSTKYSMFWERGFPF